MYVALASICNSHLVSSVELELRELWLTGEGLLQRLDKLNLLLAAQNVDTVITEDTESVSQLIAKQPQLQGGGEKL